MKDRQSGHRTGFGEGGFQSTRILSFFCLCHHHVNDESSKQQHIELGHEEKKHGEGWGYPYSLI